MSNYAHPNSLASTQWVADHLEDPFVRIVEVIWGSSPIFGLPVYKNGHIPGAASWDNDDDLQDRTRGDILSKDQLEELLSRTGVETDSTIVLYSSLNNMLATYAFWQLKLYGHRAVRLLDGDRQKWLDEKRPLVTEVPAVIRTTYRVKETDQGMRADREEVLKAISRANHLLVDARSAEMYNGLDKAGAARGGHIPGAVNIPAYRETNLDGSFRAWRVPTVQPDGTFRPAAELCVLFDSLGITPDKEIITYCGRGGLSTHAWFVLTQLLGYPNVREYDRSWAEWGNLDGAPIESQQSS